jgi:hypothetical protein
MNLADEEVKGPTAGDVPGMGIAIQFTGSGLHRTEAVMADPPMMGFS